MKKQERFELSPADMDDLNAGEDVYIGKICIFFNEDDPAWK